jgi:hypothetical protein
MLKVGRLVCQPTLNMFPVSRNFVTIQYIVILFGLTRSEVPKLWGVPLGVLVILRGAICLCEGHIYFERNMGAR